MNAKLINSILIALGGLAVEVRANNLTTAALVSGGTTTVAVCFPICVDSTATDFTIYTIDSGAAFVVPPATLLADNQTVLLNVIGLDGSDFQLNIADGQIQTCAGGVIAGVTLTGMVESRFTVVDVGAPTIAGQVYSCGAGQLGLVAGGNLSEHQSDHLTFAYETLTGDFDRKAQLASLSPSDVTDAFAQSGLMVRASIDPNALALKYMATSPMGDNSIRSLVRADYQQPEDEVDRAYGGVASNLPNQWLRLKRTGNSFQMFVGIDGVNWALAARRWQELPATVLVGCYAVAGTEGATVSVRFNTYTNVDLGDHTAPTLVSAGTLDKAKVGVKFSEALNSASATVLANYSVFNANSTSATVTGAALGIEGDAVYLSVTGLTSDTFTVRVNGGVSDSAGNTIAAPVSVSAKFSSWVSEDVGYIQDPANRPLAGDDPFRPGQAVAVSSDTNPEIEIIGGGSNLREAGDYGHYVHRSMTGDFDVMAEITRFDRCYETGGFPAAGLMVRNGLYIHGQEYSVIGTRVPYYANVTCAEDTLNISAVSIWRDSPYGFTEDSLTNKGVAVFTGDLINGLNGAFGSLRSGNAAGASLPNSSANSSRWLRVKRVGDHFTSYASYDGKAWRQFEDADHPLDPTVEVGLFIVNDSGNTPPQGNAYDGDNQRASMYSVVHVRHLGTSPMLNLARLGANSASLSWTTGRLQCAPAVIGPWIDCPNQANPQTVTVGPAGTQFYRLK